ncbi:hypothetical protein COW36_09475 [bacterium (Candidatus Blackallbacteria) CG17_big_fil_post_rev_8_21_14_2_50_48_46]|uniref:Nucleotidyltransferase family protein n=1 Tax=bacterium (Candidatus Blackallbacteria) CG17_big_fil_post_rev_8_21_14_2_50_48_46 TaxID=2014261 RepID=A0A2M7G5K7_9BACT|nr:MAG: hypothetical protein COW64_01935 [bacterium (Candidatus Blackallbacteria) CG18_big_fil_WC_8_21_14_2_50_49_26]PIW17193.1 MAG: hypothetical protein COW36_09475 [bacterium (Candidatus Blackallbacteria) CG17_big_fil_post_rev_8_21_14_2_50_48_46]PIW50984.1 MAG: hypothetical protein COW20_00485 [bacterium (Candidatus Blackallbacteria) CG13_big_fil_rev_8_21_14_2_50_49_14]
MALCDENQALLDYLRQNKQLWHILKTLPELPCNAWLAAGSIMETVWNLQAKFPADRGIRDYDLIYCDPGDLSWEAEDRLIQHGRRLWPNLEIEIRNQSRVHLWYPERFHIAIEPLTSITQAMLLWPATCHAIAVKLVGEELEVIAPWGLEDLWQGIARPNPACPDTQAFQKKVQRWTLLWDLTVCYNLKN